jgi:hypothetical protein
MAQNRTDTPLSWERGHPERSSWTTHTISVLQTHFTTLDTASDTSQFAPKYHQLSDEQKLVVWGELISAVAFFESSWNPCSRYKEPMSENDSITGEPIYSEGLLQLSYQDVKSYPQLNLPFDWAADKHLLRTDCAKTILDPFRNLTGGISILTYLVSKHRKVILMKPYWSTLRDPATAKTTKVNEIIAMVKKLPFVI